MSKHRIQSQFGRRTRFPRVKARAFRQPRVLSPMARYALFGLAAVAVGIGYSFFS